MNNTEFLNVLTLSFVKYLNTNSRSNEKLKILHSAIAKDILERLNDKKYKILSLGLGEGKEATLSGKYYNKAVDITIKENNEPIAGIAVKFVMSNYSQNSNNYFENMLGETANIKSNNIPYFHIFIIGKTIPYFESGGIISKWEHINKHNIEKYTILSNDTDEKFFHAPNKTLFCIVDFSAGDHPNTAKTKQEYVKYYLNNDITASFSKDTFSFGKAVIYNNYELFAEKVAYAIKSI